jgi:hypothetical protein
MSGAVIFTGEGDGSCSCQRLRRSVSLKSTGVKVGYEDVDSIQKTLDEIICSGMGEKGGGRPVDACCISAKS